MTILPISLAVSSQYKYSESYLDSLDIAIRPGENRPYVYSGEGDAFFYGTTDNTARGGHIGYYWGIDKIRDDFQIGFNSDNLNRSEAEAHFKPYELQFNTLILIFLPFLAENRLSRYFLKVSSCEFRAASFELQVSSCKFRAASFELQVKNCQFRISNFELRILYFLFLLKSKV